MKAPPVSLLEHSATEGRLPGSLLLTGGDAAMLEREALRLSARLLCREEADTELSCASCRRVFEGIHPDLFRAEPDGVQIRIDRVREALVFAAGRPYEGPRRVALVSQADQLGLEAGNALLKSLEEPGALMHWILTTVRPETLLSTIRSRCVPVRVPSLPLSERLRRWRSLGHTEEEAADLALLAPGGDPGDPPAAERLEAFRQWRETVVAALLQIVTGRKVRVVILLAESLAKAERADARVLAELLADAAVLAAGGSPESLRHRAVGGPLREIGASRSPTVLRSAALKAADAPPDNRRGNRRLHFEALLLELALGS